MNIQSNGVVTVLAKNERTGSNNQTYYNLAVLIGGEAGNLSCTEEAYNDAVPNEENDVVYAYNDQYKSMRIIQARLRNSLPSGSAPARPKEPDKAVK